jgi:MFS family permease
LVPGSNIPSSLPPPRRRGPFSSFRHRNFRVFFFGYTVSLVGVWMHRVAQSWLVLDLTDSAFYVGLASALTALPVLLFTLYAGVLADRVSKHRMVVTTQAASMVVGLALAAVVLAGVVELWHVLFLATLLGVATAFDIPARQSFLVELVGRDDLGNAIALNSSAFNASRVVGPAVAGLLIAAVGVGLCFLLNGISYAAVLVALVAMRLPPFQPRHQPTSTWERVRDGVRYVMGDARMRVLIVNVAALSVFGFPVVVLLPVVARDVLGRGAEAFGWMTAAVGIGALAGALGLAVFGGRIHRGKTVAWTSAAFGVLVAAFGLARSLGPALALLAAGGFVQIVTTALTNMLLQTLAPDELRGRVVSFYTFAFLGLTPFGALQAGTVASRVGAGSALVVGGIVCALASLMLVRSRELRGTP